VSLTLRPGTADDAPEVSAYHNRSLSLYAKLGFVVREPLATMQGPPLRQAIPGHTVRPATLADVEACNRLCMDVHGFHRGGELAVGIQHGSARVVERAGRITGCASAVGFFGYATGESNDDIKALLAAAPNFQGPGFLLPMRNAGLLRWCLEHGLLIVHMDTLMSVGLYNQPQGAFLPSIGF